MNCLHNVGTKQNYKKEGREADRLETLFGVSQTIPPSTSSKADITRGAVIFSFNTCTKDYKMLIKFNPCCHPPWPN